MHAGLLLKNFKLPGIIRNISVKGIVKLGSSLGSIFLLFPIRVARAHAHSSWGKSPAPSSC